MGYEAMILNTTGAYNTAVGKGALRTNAIGKYNVAMGARSLYSMTGNCSTAVGFNALSSATGKNNTALGFCANPYITTDQNTIAVGWCALTSTGYNNHTVWGNSSNNACNCVYVAWSVVSDCRDKTNIKPLPSGLGLSFLKKIKPVTYNWDNRDTYVRECGFEYGTKDGTLSGVREHYGVIAQDVKAAIDELGVKFDALGHDKDKDAYRVTYEELIAPIIKAIQELDARVEDLEKTCGNK